MRNSRSLGRCIAMPAFLLATATAVQAAPKVEPTPADMLPKVRGEFPAVKSRLLEIEKAGSNYIAVGEYGHIIMSADGTTWKQVPAPHSAMLNSVEFVNGQVGWAVGHDHTILKTTDGGATWNLQFFEANPSKPWYDTQFLDANNGFVVGSNGRIMKTTNGGGKWEDVPTFIDDLGMHTNNITKLNDGTLLIVGERSLIARSSDNGATWEMVKTPYAGTWFGTIPNGDKGALFFGLRGNVYVTDDVSALAAEDPEEWDEFDVETVQDPEELAAAGWRKLNTGTGNSLFGGSQLSDGSAVILGVGGVALKTNPQMTQVTRINNPQSFTLGDAIERGDGLIAVGVAGVQSLSR